MKLPNYMTLHVLKIAHDPYTAIASGSKKAEILRSDRHYKTGDLLELQQIRDDGTLTGRNLRVQVTHIQEGQGPYEGFIILSFRRLEPANEFDAHLLHGES